MIKVAREKKGWTQQQLAEELGVSSGYVSNWENAHAYPSNFLNELEEILEIPLHIGSWLRETRKERNISVKELSNKSGYSTGYIYNIENRTIVNPKSETLQNLAEILGTDELPIDPRKTTLDEDVEESEGSSIGEYYTVDLEYLEEVSGVSGVYIFWSANDLPTYIGQSGNIATRYRQHRDKFWFKEPIVSYMTVIEIEDERVRKSVERILIDILRNTLLINSV